MMPQSLVGGGYTKNNVARCWTYETAVLVGEELAENLPPNVYQEYYQPDYKLNRKSTRVMENANSKLEIERIKIKAMENLRHLAHTPGLPFLPVISHAAHRPQGASGAGRDVAERLLCAAVQMQYAPPSANLPEWDIEEEEDPEVRLTAYARDHRLLEDMGDYFEEEDAGFYL